MILSFFRRTTSQVLPLRHDPSMAFMPWIMGITLYLTLVFIATLFLMSESMRGKMTSHPAALTLEIPLSKGQRSRDVQTHVMSALKDHPAVHKLIPVDPLAIHRAAQELLGSKKLPEGESIPLPAFFYLVSKKPSRSTHLAILGGVRSLGYSDAVIRSHHQWVVPWQNWFKTCHVLLWGGAAVFLGLTLLVFAFSLRTSIAIHWPVLEILSMMGASTTHVSGQFQHQMLRLVGRSFLITAGFVVLTVVGCFFLFEGGLSLWAYKGFLLIVLVFLPIVILGLMSLLTHVIVKWSLHSPPLITRSSTQ